LATKDEIFRCAVNDEHKYDMKIWLKKSTTTKPCGDGKRSLDLVKTIEMHRLHLAYAHVVYQQPVCCAECNDKKKVGLTFTNYKDSSDFSVQLDEYKSKPRYATDLSTVLHCKQAKLQIKFEDNNTHAALVMFDVSSVAVNGEQKSAEQLVWELYAQSPNEKEKMLGSKLPQPNGKLRQFAAALHKSEKAMLVLPYLLSNHFTSKFEQLHAQIRVVGEFLSPANDRDAKKPLQKKALFQTPSPLFEKFKQLIDTRKHLMADKSVFEFFQRKLDEAQKQQLKKPPKAYKPGKVDEIGVYLHCLVKTRHVLAHNRDPTGEQRRHFLRLFVNVFGARVLDNAIEFMQFCIEKLLMDSCGALFDAIVAGKDNDALKQILDKAN
jgi:hypothetical protein